MRNIVRNYIRVSLNHFLQKCILPIQVKKINKILEVMRMRVNKKKTILVHN